MRRRGGSQPQVSLLGLLPVRGMRGIGLLNGLLVGQFQVGGGKIHLAPVWREQVLSARERRQLKEIIVSTRVTRTLIGEIEAALTNYVTGAHHVEWSKHLDRKQWQWNRATRELIAEVEAAMSDGFVLNRSYALFHKTLVNQVKRVAMRTPPQKQPDQPAEALGMEVAAALVEAGVKPTLGSRNPPRRTEFIEALGLVREWADVRVGKKPLARKDLFPYARKAREALANRVANQ